MSEVYADIYLTKRFSASIYMQNVATMSTLGEATLYIIYPYLMLIHLAYLWDNFEKIHSNSIYSYYNYCLPLSRTRARDVQLSRAGLHGLLLFQIQLTFCTQNMSKLMR